MEPKRFLPGDSQPGLPVRRDAAPPEAYQRAPTLMGGEIAGSQGSVQVWSPDKSLIKRQAIKGAGAFIWVGIQVPVLLSSSLAFGAHSSSFAAPVVLCACIYLMVLSACSYLMVWMISLAVKGANWIAPIEALPALWRPCYITTDDAGIGITAWRGSSSFRWEEILALECPLTYVNLLYPRNGPPLRVNLAGYSPEQRQAFSSLIISRCHLEPDATLRRLGPLAALNARFIRPGYRFSGSGRAIPDMAPLTGNDTASALPGGKR